MSKRTLSYSEQIRRGVLHCFELDWTLFQECMDMSSQSEQVTVRGILVGVHGLVLVGK